MIAFVLCLLSLLAASSHSLPSIDAYGDPLPPGAVARLGSVRWRAPDTVLSLIFTPDGRYLIGRMPGNSFVVWSYPEGTRLAKFNLQLVENASTDEPWEPRQVDPTMWRFEKNGRTALVHCGWDKIYRVHVPDGKTELLAQGERLEACGISMDGRRRLLSSIPIAAGDGDKVHLWVVGPDVRGGRVRIATLPGYVSERSCGEDGCGGRAILSPDGRFAIARFLAGGEELGLAPAFAAFDLATGQSWTVTHRPADELRFGPDGRTIVSTDREHIAIWKFATGGDGLTQFRRLAVTSFRTMDDDSTTVCFTPDGRRIVANIPAKGVRIFDANTLRLERTIKMSERRPGNRALAVAPDGRTLAVSLASPATIEFFELNTGRQIRSRTGHVAPIDLLDCDATGRRLLSRSVDGALRVWDLPNVSKVVRVGREIATLNVNLEAHSFVFPSGGLQVIFPDDGVVWRWQVGSDRATRLLSTRERLIHVWLCGDGSEILVADTSDQLTRWRIDGKPKELPPIELSGEARRIDFDSDGKEIWIYRGDERLRLDRATGKPVAVSAQPSPVAERYSVRCRVGEFRVEVCDVATQHSRFVDEPRLADSSSSVAIGTLGSVSADARVITYVTGDSAVVRDLDTGEEVARFEREDGTATTAVLTPNGDFLTVGYDDGQILVWDLRVRPADTDAADRLWADLGADANTARRAAARLLRDPKFALSVLADRVRPLASPTEDDVCQWVGELDHSRFAVRERATRLLVRHHEGAKRILELAAAEKISVELGERLARIKEMANKPVADGELLRVVRAIAVLERIPDKRAADLLRRVAAGDGLPATRAGDALVRRTAAFR